MDQLRRLGRREGTTLHMTLLAAFQVFLARYSGQEDIAVGLPIAGRQQVELEPLIGFFVNTLVLRTDLSGEPTFRELLARVRQVSLEAYDHQELPFEKLVEELNPERDLSRHPLFQVIFQLSEFGGDELKLADLEVSPLANVAERVRFDLEMHLRTQSDEEPLRGTVAYSTDLFLPATIDRMVGHFQTLLNGIVADPDTKIGALPLLTEPQRQRLLVEWNDTARPYPRHKCVHELFEEQAARTPDAVALIGDDRELTYRELNERANQVAHHLASLGVGPEFLVGVFLERSPDLIASLIGILKAGGAYLPLDLEAPPQRLASLLADAGVRLMLTQTSLRDRLAATGVERLCLDERTDLLASQSRANCRSSATAENLAYVMYTSGSTGQPKGVAIPHRAINRLLLGVDYARFDASLRVAQMAPVSFDASTLEIWSPLLHGGCCVLFPDGLRDLAELEQGLKRHKVQTLWLTTSLFNAIIDQRPQTLQGIEQLLIGGEALSVPHVRRALSLLGQTTELINGYGPTESTTFACCYRIPETLSAETISVPIGRPIANTTVYVLDRNAEPVPIGVPGELYIGGDGLARGYLRRPGLTSAMFVPQSLSEALVSRRYRTGDRVRWLSDGTLEFLGRVDHQVKIRGFRVELGEIEAVLGIHPTVRQCTATVREESLGEKRLVAYWAAQPDATATSSDLREYVRASLPGYMISDLFVRLDRLPMNEHGKLDRRALPEPDALRPELDMAYVAPRDDFETQMTAIWAGVLGLERVGIHDNFFDLGGHSLLALRLLVAMERAFPVRLSLMTVFRHPTIAQLKRVIREPHPELSGPVMELLRAGEPDQPPLVCAPSLFGDAHEWRRVAKLLPEGRAIYGLRVAGTEPYWRGCQSLQDVAKGFVTALMAAGWTGPCHLVGYSFGGMMAFEVARQLAAAGGRVGSVVVVDTGPPDGDRHLGKSLVRDLPSMVRNFPRWVWMDVVQSPRQFLERARRELRSRLAPLMRRAEQNEEELPHVDPRLAGIFDVESLPALYRERVSISWRLVRQYRPSRYGGYLTVLRCRTQPLIHRANPDLGWGKWVDGPLEIREFPGNHSTVFSDHYLRDIATAIKNALSNYDKLITK